MKPAKLSLSTQERALVADAEWILTKNAILEKVKTALEQTYQWQKEYTASILPGLPQILLEHHGKISKGEYYQGLPYLILDYPRNFKRDHIFAIRSMFWWGRQISTTLHISGEWQQFFRKKLVTGLPVLQEQHFYWAQGNEEWDHDIQGHNYHPIHDLSKQEWALQLQKNSFIKIAAFNPVTDLEQAPLIWKEWFQIILELLA